MGFLDIFRSYTSVWFGQDGRSIEVRKNQIFVDGREYIPVGGYRPRPENVLETLPGGSKQITLTQDAVIEAVEGNLYIRVPNDSQVTLEILGDVGGDVDTGGNVTIHQNVGGYIDAGGSITVRGNVQKDASAGGSITAHDIGGDADAGGSITAHTITGDIDAGGVVTYLNR